MKSEYENLNEFIDDCHGQLSIRQIVTSMDIIPSSDFRGDFVQCIFHQGDNTPSLQIKESFFKCYACGAKGDIFKFLMLHYDLTFMEAVKYLADFLHVVLKDFNYRYDGRMAELKKKWEGYLEAFANAPESIQRLQRDYFPEEIGYDKEIGYIVLPLTSKTGSILGFTKRRIDFLHKKNEKGDYNSPKWKHSSLNDSLISQCKNIYNLYDANQAMKKTNSVIVTEGPKDVIAYKRIGHPEALCSCGTNNITNCFDMILPIKSLVLSTDSDKAGIKAVKEAVLFLAPSFDIRRISVVSLPDGKDPYDVSSEELREAYKNRKPAIYFIIEKFDDPELLQEIYGKVQEYNRMYVIKAICKVKLYSALEAKSWMSGEAEAMTQAEKSEKESLLAVVNGESDDPYMHPDKARRILKMKYGIVV